MLYRRFPRIADIEVSALGLGCMRLPTLAGDPARIDEAAADALLTAALEAGINYVDTAWPYHRGMSEPWLGAALERLNARDHVYLATKSPTWLVKEESDWEGFLAKQLERLRTDRIDFYLMHAFNRERWATVVERGGLEFLARAKADGRLGHVGFSFHDSFDVFRGIVDGWDGWDFCQIQYNYLDEDYQAGTEGLRLAEEKGLGVVVMEPLRGGALARVPEEALAIFARHDKPRMPVEWALRHVLDRQEVVTTLSGMGSVRELWENAAIASSAHANAIPQAERAVIEEVRRWFQARLAVPCTECGYCKPCPAGVQIPRVFSLWNEQAMFSDQEVARRAYASEFGSGGGAGACVRCGACLPRCPQGIAIPERLAEAALALGASAAPG